METTAKPISTYALENVTLLSFIRESFEQNIKGFT